MLLKLLYLTTYSLSTVNSVLGHCDDRGHSERVSCPLST